MYLFMDDETGGLDPAVNPLLQAYFSLRDRQLREVDRLMIYRKVPEGAIIDPQAMAINKIDLDEHAGRAMDADLCQTYVELFLKTGVERFGCKLMPVGWNHHMDIAFNKAQLTTPDYWRKHVEYRALDVASIVEYQKLKRKLPDTITSLKKACEYFNIDTTGNHEARKDVEMTAALLKALIFFN